MIHILRDKNDRVTNEIVVRAFERSFTRGQIREIDSCLDIAERHAIVIAISPDWEAVEPLRQLMSNGSKVVLQGSLNAAMAEIAGVTVVVVGPDLRELADSEVAPAGETRVSRAALRYSDEGIGRASPLRQRHFCRYDFTNEWNNLGYGRIGIGNGRWSIAQMASRFETPVAMVEIDGGSPVGAAVTLRDFAHGAVLWFARPVGVVDGQDWAVMEDFISRYRADGLPCRPHLKGIPHGYEAAVSMRLDCDEDVASARPLFDFYLSRSRPLSLAVATDRLESEQDIALISDVLRAGGSVLSHSATHAPEWGGSEEAAEREARDSKARLEELITGLQVRYAVSPFHQNPAYVPGALARAGYQGFIGGSIASDPEFLMARGGIPPFGPPSLVSHSQSCMLHGDCMLAGDDPLSVFKEAFRLARDSREFFGYLDHPFSARYAYGWRDEETRIAAHAAYLDFIGRECRNGRLLFVNEDACMRFIADRANAIVRYDERSQSYTISQTRAAGFPLSISYRGEVVEAAV